MTQNEAILKHLRDGKKIDPMTALQLFGCWALSSRIAEIKGKSGHVRLLKKNEIIVSKMVKATGKRRYAQYALVNSKAAAEWDRMRAKA